MTDIKVKNGLHAGIVIVIIGTILHAMNPRTFLNSYGFVGYMVFLFYMIRSVAQSRKSNEGIISFGEAFGAAFVTMTVGVFFSSTFMYAVHNWINPDLALMVKEVALESAEFVSEKASTYFDMDLDAEEVKAVLEQQDFRLNIGTTFASWFMTSVMGSIPALIMAAFMKRGED